MAVTMEPLSEAFELVIDLKFYHDQDLYNVSEKRMFWYVEAEEWIDKETVIFSGSKVECLNFLSEKMDILLRGADNL